MVHDVYHLEDAVKGIGGHAHCSCAMGQFHAVFPLCGSLAEEPLLQPPVVDRIVEECRSVVQFHLYAVTFRILYMVIARKGVGAGFSCEGDDLLRWCHHPYVDVARHACRWVRVGEGNALAFQYAARHPGLIQHGCHLDAGSIHLSVGFCYLFAQHKGSHVYLSWWALLFRHHPYAPFHHALDGLLLGQLHHQLPLFFTVHVRHRLLTVFGLQSHPTTQ